MKLNDDDLRSLPSWSEIESVIGSEPIILGLDKCQVYQSKIPPLRRMLGASGMFNSGTNLVSQCYYNSIQESCCKFTEQLFYRLLGC